MMSIHPDEFAIPFFKENGFVRRKCVACGSDFWTQIPDRRTCGDVPCEDYGFIGKPPTRARYNLREMRDKFLSFFAERGHTIIKPYPIVARWRDDVYLVGASIYDFQPYVTEGVMPPPANPLVISQPCIRFTDIDNVGPTMGRHLLIFEMGGHHAFNYPEREIYWKDQTIRYHHELLTDELGVESELVTYKEHFWSGGGNAGPDVEACVQGLEISTLVFMQYKVVGDRLTALPIRTVDTGYGMERWTWLSQGSPTQFHAVYGRVLEKVLALSGIKVDEAIIAENARFSGLMDISKVADRLKARMAVAQRLGMDWRMLEDMLTPAESVFAIADHTKAIAFLLAEGVVPSNVREGYLTRLLMRRTYRMLRRLGVEQALPEIVDFQIEYWGESFPNLIAMRDEIMQALAVEEKKYRRTLARGSDLVSRLARELRSKGLTQIPADKLVELYDSHGLSPDFVGEIAGKEGIKVEIPGDFFGRVAQRHISPAVHEPQLLADLKEKVSGLPPTRQLYYEDAYRREFEAKVLAVMDGEYVVLDRTCFYPEGGGQPADHGSLRWPTGDAKVDDVQRIGGVIVHRIDGPPPAAGQLVKGEVDWNRRSHLMRHHTATHIILAAARRVLGEHVWQAGAQKGVEWSRLDITHYERIAEAQVHEIERLATEIALKDVPVEAIWLPREKAEAQYGFRLYQGGAVPGREIRVVKIGDWDVEACGGTHVRSTGEVGIIKILKAERIQDGVERLIFAAGLQALRAFQERDSMLARAAKVLDAPIEDLDRYAQSLLSEKELLLKRMDGITKRLVHLEARSILAEARRVGGLKLAVRMSKEGEEEEMMRLARELTETDPAVVAVLVLAKDTARIYAAAGEKALGRGVHAGRLAGDLAKLVGGGGGGKQYFGQGGGAIVEKVDEVLRAAKPALLKQLRR